MEYYDGGTVVGRVYHAEPDSRNHLTGVVANTTVSDLEKGAWSANVCGMSALCLSASSKKEKKKKGIGLNGDSFPGEIWHLHRTVYHRI